MLRAQATHPPAGLDGRARGDRCCCSAGVTLVGGLLTLRDPRARRNGDREMSPRTPAAEEAVRKLEPILARHRRPAPGGVARGRHRVDRVRAVHAVRGGGGAVARPQRAAARAADGVVRHRLSARRAAAEDAHGAARRSRPAAPLLAEIIGGGRAPAAARQAELIAALDAIDGGARRGRASAGACWCSSTSAAGAGASSTACLDPRGSEPPAMIRARARWPSVGLTAGPAGGRFGAC